MAEEIEQEDVDIFTDNEDYHKDTTRISKSGLDLIRRSPLHYYSKYLDPDRERRPETPALKQGKITHSFVFEPEKIAREYAILPEGLDLRTVIGKAKKKEFDEENRGKTVITKQNFDLAQNIKKSIHNHTRASVLLAAGAHEELVLWEDFEYGLKCKCRLDKNSNTQVGNFITDLKTTTDASPVAFGRSALKYRYHVQGAFYSDAYMHKYGQPPQGFVFIAVETKPPYAVAIYHLTPEQLELGRREYIEDLGRYKECIETGEFPGYSDMIQPLQFPAYAFKQF